ncbi:hypothetical protein C7A11_05440 [Pseudomonas simiae]|uniref:AAA family ATPase n=1 Tax=Pseudomonas simiae TaxID=321846 RepID=UPI000D0369ED|nr:AAA family ATPase [Pseudomonas simiae]PRW90179.1 hypothetical protein C7A11_05440 [Pseudomonas simiae]
MHLHSYRLRNFRRLKDAHIELADDISIFVGSNNSGKTSATQAIHAFVTGGRDRFSLYDFSSSCWKCSGLMKPDTHLGENARQIEVSDEQTTPLLYS